jgi:hypothetical protein
MVLRLLYAACCVLRACFLTQERLKVEDLLSGRTRDNMSVNLLAADAAKAR